MNEKIIKNENDTTTTEKIIHTFLGEAVSTYRKINLTDEKEHIDHVCFVVHGIGEGDNSKFWLHLEEFRKIAQSVIDTHLKPHIQFAKLSGRLEFIPVSWYQELPRYGCKNISRN
jgi:hypothetical protein